MKQMNKINIKMSFLLFESHILDDIFTNELRHEQNI